MGVAAFGRSPTLGVAAFGRSPSLALPCFGRCPSLGVALRFCFGTDLSGQRVGVRGPTALSSFKQSASQGPPSPWPVSAGLFPSALLVWSLGRGSGYRGEPIQLFVLGLMESRGCSPSLHLTLPWPACCPRGLRVGVGAGLSDVRAHSHGPSLARVSLWEKEGEYCSPNKGRLAAIFRIRLKDIGVGRKLGKGHKLDEARSHGGGPQVPTLGKWRGGGSWKALLGHGLGHGRLD